MTMYERIKELCDRAGITVTDLSYDTGVRQSTLANLKKREGNLNGENLYSVARYFGVSMEYLMGKEAN